MNNQSPPLSGEGIKYYKYGIFYNKTADNGASGPE